MSRLQRWLRRYRIRRIRAFADELEREYGPRVRPSIAFLIASERRLADELEATL